MAESENTSGEFSNLILALNGGLLSETPWRTFLIGLRSFVGAKYATLIITPRNSVANGVIITPGANDIDIRTYHERYMAIDPFVGLPEGKVVALYEYISEQQLKNSPYYEWLKDIDGAHILGVDIRLVGRYEVRLRVTRAIGGDAFTRTEFDRLQRLVPHVRQAIELYDRQETNRSEQAVMIGAIEQFSVGTVILDHNLEVVKMNETAAAILAEEDALVLRGKRVVITDPDQNRELRTRLKDALAAPRAFRKLVLMIERPSGNRTIGVAIRPIFLPNFMHAGTVPAIALFLSDPKRQRDVSSETLRMLFRFTPAEAEISAFLSNGFSVIEAADKLAVTENTVRTHLRSIFAKTGVCRQSQLVHLIHTSMPELAEGQ